MKSETVWLVVGVIALILVGGSAADLIASNSTGSDGSGDGTDGTGGDVTGGTVGQGTLTPEQIAQVASNAGFSGNDLITSVAVALAESGGNSMAHGDRSLGSGTGSFGLWQIYSDAHPEYGPDFTKLYDPQTNANAAFAIYRAAGKKFTPWSTFNHGQYASFVQSAQGAVQSA